MLLMRANGCARKMLIEDGPAPTQQYLYDYAQRPKQRAKNRPLYVAVACRSNRITSVADMCGSASAHDRNESIERRAQARRV